ncbi:MAG: type II toxin-antitoxin system RelE/ParE family toxin [Methylicorpusculum sp.]|uniref:type II toxin-antitoxin system RelE/ParE family toxin n=1 Tax=Methylicorpusculum sp. TaxID=2713644 RepID=UPI002716A139|nr:type II toxin-antitoxin system RelE/ParE family toxin [Methylicorpusculum sp.]MDO9239886.1 type II toxin-antitoxin system RelE/ParE family toxin [Methylicorpusculum sp.]MDP2180756.1 type II toxin-antitoxin system RelE/ParE family toxin [Methylicorpusculum sp.]MDP2204536.1 type II toxin-antitoxin system RelE/ParE family toxin [Methylicorpusculum sp.]MDZ4151904.1 type II toxin-antitoxin system RelE/ParE family toxin [Methylicorpusculum sp.]
MGCYKLSKKARSDLKRIWLYGVNTHGNQRYHQGMLDRFALIAEQPYLYQAIDSIRAGYRRSVYGTDSIYYRINGDIVEIMAIIGYQDTEDWL